MDDVDLAVKKLKDALLVLEWHFKDAVEDLMEQSRREGVPLGIYFDEED